MGLNDRNPHLSRTVATAAWAAATMAVVGVAATFIAGLTFPGPAQIVVAVVLVLGAGIWGPRALATRLKAPAATPLRPAALPGAFAAGVAPAAVLCLLLWLTGSVQFSPGGLDAGTPLIALLAAALGWCTELFIRGTAFSIVEERAGGHVALWVSVVLAAGVDIVLGRGPLAVLTLGGMGVLWGRMRLADGNPAGAALCHAAWNGVLAVALGVGLGTGSASLLLPGPQWWAGLPGHGQGGVAALAVAVGCATTAAPWLLPESPGPR